MADVDFEEVYRTCFRQVYAYVFSLCGNRCLTEEVTQETFFKALKQLDRFRGDCKISVWLCQIAKNTLFSLQRKKEEKFSKDHFLEEDLFDQLLSREEAFASRSVVGTGLPVPDYTSNYPDHSPQLFLKLPVPGELV